MLLNLIYSLCILFASVLCALTTGFDTLWAVPVWALGFVLGFTVIFVAMGALAGTVGGFFSRYQTAVNIISGIVVIFFGLNYMGVFKLNLFKGNGAMLKNKELGFFSSLLFGMIFSIGWTPCVGAILGSVLMMASQEGKVLEGAILLLVYSIGLGVPFVLSAVLINELKSAFDFIKKHYKVINKICGIFLIIGIGVMYALSKIDYNFYKKK